MEDLIKAAEGAGYATTPRMVQDWVELGLLGQPERHGLGRGKGSTASWSDNQRGLFLSLLDHRQRVGRVAVLANIPVWTWLYFGDDYVELRQVRRALKTWSEPNMRLSITAARQAARQVLDDVNHPKARRADRKALLDTAAAMFFHGSERLDEARLVPLLRRVMDPKGGGVSRTMGAVEYTPEAFVRLLRVRLTALEALEDEAIDDSLFHWVRFTNAVSRAKYQWLIAQKTTVGGTVAEARVPTMGEIAPRSCLDVVTLLGLGLQMPAGAISVSLEHPDVWKRQRLRSIVHGSLVAGGVQVTVEAQAVEKAKPGKPQ